MMRLLAALFAVVALLAGCAQAGSVTQVPGVTLAPPTPAGMQELPPEPVRVPPGGEDECDRTASLRPFSDPAEADAAVANIRERGRLIVGLDIGSHLLRCGCGLGFGLVFNKNGDSLAQEPPHGMFAHFEFGAGGMPPGTVPDVSGQSHPRHEITP